MKKHSCIGVRCVGHNISRLINILLLENIKMSRLSRVDGCEILFEVTNKDLKKLQKLNLVGYEISINYNTDFQSFTKWIIVNCGVFVGLILSMALFFVLSNRMLAVKVVGLQKYSKEEIVKEINDYGLDYFDKMNFNEEELANYLQKSFDFSLVSVLAQGNVLIINVKEELQINKYEPIVADYDMIIDYINVVSGLALVKEGDIVYKGDVLVYPYEIINDEKIEVKPIANISATTYCSSRYNFIEKEVIRKRTGNYKVINTCYFMGERKILNFDYANPYAISEEGSVCDYVSHYLLPIKISKTIVYELQEIEVVRDFEEEKAEIIKRLKDSVYNMVTPNMKIEGEEIVISSTNYGNIVTIYLKSSVYLIYK